MRDLRPIGRQFFRGTAFAALLERCGIEPHRYWILVDLFQTLSKRQEVIRMGSHNQSLRHVVIPWFIMGIAVCLLMFANGASSGVYLLVFVGLTVLALSLVLISEVAASGSDRSVRGRADTPVSRPSARLPVPVPARPHADTRSESAYRA